VPREFSIAVIDDDESFRLALIGSLRSFGYGASGFASAEKFLAGGGQGTFDCIITDLHMPGMSGLDLMEQLAAQASKSPVIMVTGRPEAGLEAKAAAGGAVCLLRKPFQTDVLISCLEKALKI
jgi:FixJ family two-component response regulator